MSCKVGLNTSMRGSRALQRKWEKRLGFEWQPLMDWMLLKSALGGSPRAPVTGDDNEGTRSHCGEIKSEDNTHHARKASWPRRPLWPSLFILSPVTKKKKKNGDTAGSFPPEKASCNEKHHINANFNLMLCMWIRRIRLLRSAGLCSLAWKDQGMASHRVAASRSGAPHNALPKWLTFRVRRKHCGERSCCPGSFLLY